MRTCFNALNAFASADVYLPVVNTYAGTTVATGNLLSLLAATGAANIVNLLAEVTLPVAVTVPTLVNIYVYSEAGGVEATLTNYPIPANGCVSFRTDNTADPLFRQIHTPGRYMVVVDDPAIQAAITPLVAANVETGVIGVAPGTLVGTSDEVTVQTTC